MNLLTQTLVNLLTRTDTVTNMITEIHECSKKFHFKNIHKQTGIDYSDMIFFDNEVCP